MSKNVTELTRQDFNSKVIDSKTPCIVDFWATWCAPCRAIAPTIEELAGDFKGKFGFFKVNIDDYSDLATKFNVMNIPTLILFKDGSEAGRIVGAVSRDDIEAKINSLIK